MLIEAWDADYIADQEQIFGRFKTSGAPLTGHHEFDPVDLDATKPDGSPVIAADAHIRLAAPATNGGQKILRRGYSYTDGTDPVTGALDAGLFFIAYQQDPHRQFARIQRRLGQSDLLNEYIVHRGGGVFAVPPGRLGSGRLVRQAPVHRLVGRDARVGRIGAQLRHARTVPGGLPCRSARDAQARAGRVRGARRDRLCSGLHRPDDAVRRSPWHQLSGLVLECGELYGRTGADHKLRRSSDSVWDQDCATTCGRLRHAVADCRGFVLA